MLKVSKAQLILINPSIAEAKKKAAQLSQKKEALKKFIKEPKKPSRSAPKAKTSKNDPKSKSKAPQKSPKVSNSRSKSKPVAPA